MNKTTVIYHSADFDGIFCREIARKFLPEAELIGWDFGDEPLPIPDGQIYVMDLPVDRVFGWTADIQGQLVHSGISNRLIWIDHHKSSIETHPASIPGYRIDGVAACRLAWQWFTMVDGNTKEGYVGHGCPAIRPAGVLPMVQDYKHREVNEPLAVRLAGEYDIWDKRDPNADLFQHGLRSRELTDFDWVQMLSMDKPSVDDIEKMAAIGMKDAMYPYGTIIPPTVHGLLENGKVLQYSQTKQNESVIKDIGFTLQWEGLTFLACNHARYNSHLFTAGLNPEHDACYGFKWTGKDWSISLYHAPGKEHHDLSKIAVKYGGGGHRGACGFKTEKLPFLK